MIFDDISALFTKGVSMYMGKRRTIKEVVFDMVKLIFYTFCGLTHNTHH